MVDPNQITIAEVEETTEEFTSRAVAYNVSDESGPGKIETTFDPCDRCNCNICFGCKYAN